MCVTHSVLLKTAHETAQVQFKSFGLDSSCTGVGECFPLVLVTSAHVLGTLRVFLCYVMTSLWFGLA